MYAPTRPSTFCTDELQRALTEQSFGITNFSISTSTSLRATAFVTLLEGHTITIALSTHGYSVRYLATYPFDYRNWSRTCPCRISSSQLVLPHHSKRRGPYLKPSRPCFSLSAPHTSRRDKRSWSGSWKSYANRARFLIIYILRGLGFYRISLLDIQWQMHDHIEKCHLYVPTVLTIHPLRVWVGPEPDIWNSV